MHYLTFLLPIASLLTVFMTGSAQAAEEGNTTTTLTIKGSVTEAPQCTVNNSNLINVDFGDDVEIQKLNGTSYKKTQLVYRMQCTGLTKSKMKVSITGRQAGFGNGLLYTNTTGLGIRMYHNNTVLNVGTTAVEATPVNFDYDGPGSEPLLYAVPVAQDGVRLVSGKFTGNGTLVIDYQ